MINMLDDCSRVFTGSKIYERELLLAYLDFLPVAFIEYGLPLEIYVDYHSIFFTHDPQALTQLGQALHFYGISFRYAPTPQAKGKIERSHFFWQERLPAFFASEQIVDIDQANPQIQNLRLHRNHHEVHRELKMKPHQAWNLALRKNVPFCGQPPPVLGGPSSGASARPSRLAPTVASRSALKVSASRLTLGPS